MLYQPFTTEDERVWTCDFCYKKISIQNSPMKEIKKVVSIRLDSLCKWNVRRSFKEPRQLYDFCSHQCLHDFIDSEIKKLDIKEEGIVIDNSISLYQTVISTS